MSKTYKLAFAALAIAGIMAPAVAKPQPWQAQDQVIYQIFVRSFSDSDGDRIGDLNGIRQKIGYMKSLGVTSLLLTPIAPSLMYHNYYPSDFAGIDPKFGTMETLRQLIKAAHAQGMKVYLDEEFQYAESDNPWLKDSLGNPKSRYSDRIIYNGPHNTDPESGPYNLKAIPTYTGPIEIATVNLPNPKVRVYFEQMFVNFAKAGVDGFRIDHMMDDLDGKGKIKNLFSAFWAPIFAKTRAVNPHIVFIAEQADWGYGDDWLVRGGADLAFAFPIRMAIAEFNAAKLSTAINKTLQVTPDGKGQIIFIENHDVSRFATLAGGDARKQRLGAALTVFLKGTPLIYYGQEIGMKGALSDKWHSDANDIPDREAFRWSADLEARGSAIWYKSDKPWWTERYNRSNDGVSLQEEENDPSSLVSFYRRLLAIRHAHPELVAGDEAVIATDQKNVVAVLRSTPDRASLLVANLGDQPVTVHFTTGSLPKPLDGRPLKNLINGTIERAGTSDLSLAPYEAKLVSAN
jgi:glycosidase